MQALAAPSRATFAGRTTVSATRTKAARSTVARAAENPRPIWYPGNYQIVPDYLDGSLPGDYGFDPLGLGSEPGQLAWNVQSELIHSRIAMTGVAGILFTSLAHRSGSDIPEWFNAGRVFLDRNPNVSFGALVWTTIALSGWAEFKRLADIRAPGSQGDGSFLGITDDFKGKGNGYPGGKYFDFLGLSHDPALFAKYKQNEITNGRLAMVAFVGFAAQYSATGKGPIDNLVDHLASPYTTTFTTNGVSVPFLGH